jgi:hypothetical protein
MVMKGERHKKLRVQIYPPPTLNLASDIVTNNYSHASVFADSVSAVSIIRGLPCPPPPPKKMEN